MSRWSNRDFVHFHTHSSYSNFDGLANVDKLVKQAREMEFPAIALTDHGNVSGFIKFLKECAATKDKDGKEIPSKPIKPILGCEMYLSKKMEWQKKDDAEKNGGYQVNGPAGNHHINLYAMNWQGYQNICALSHDSWLDGFYSNPRIDLFKLAEHSEGIMIGTACLSSFVNQNLLNDRYDKALESVGVLKEITKGNIFLEAMYHGYAKQRAILPDIYKLSKASGVPVVATNDIHYLKKEDAKSQEVVMAISTSNCLTNPKHMCHLYPELYMKSCEEMAKIFGHVPQSLTNSVAMAEKINTDDIVRHLFVGGMKLPPFPLPEGFKEPIQYLAHLSKEGMKRLGWDKSQPHIEQLKVELRDLKVALDVNDFDFPTYFLIVWDICNFAREKGITKGYGRGSGSASVALNCLDIVNGIDPLASGLLWQRFLGFSDLQFVIPKDFGLRKDGKVIDIVSDSSEETDDIVEEENEEDEGGIGRY
jgi:DNA polymerase III subunit alpha